MTGPSSYLYFAIIAGISWWAVKKKNEKSAEDYFLAGRHLGWFIIGASIFASNIGSEHLVGLAGSGATDGVALAHYELHAWCLLVLGWVMVPFFMRSKVFTMPEFLERRFTPQSKNSSFRHFIDCLYSHQNRSRYLCRWCCIQGLLPEINFMGMDTFWIGSIILIVLTGIYTIVGGLRAVVYTETLQTFIKILGAIFVTCVWIGSAWRMGQAERNMGSEMFNLWKPIVPDGVEGTWAPVKEAGRQAWYFNDKYPWPGMLLCAPIIGLWYWCTDQYIVQRVLGAPNIKEARRGIHLRRLFETYSCISFHHSRYDLFCIGKKRHKCKYLQKELFDANGILIRDRAQAAFPLLVMHVFRLE